MAYRRTAQIQARLDAQRAAIVTAAADLLADEGYAGCSVAAVAARAAVAAGTVYNHFESKTGLLTEVLGATVTREVEAVRRAGQDGGAAERVTAVIDTFAGRALKDPRLAYALLAEPVDPAAEQVRLTFRLALRDVIAGAIRAGMLSGELPPQDANITAAGLVGAITEALVGPLAATGDPATVPALIAFAQRSIGAVSAGLVSTPD